MRYGVVDTCVVDTVTGKHAPFCTVRSAIGVCNVLNERDWTRENWAWDNPCKMPHSTCSKKEATTRKRLCKLAILLLVIYGSLSLVQSIVQLINFCLE